LRAALADTPFGTADGPLSVTASFGVASLEPGTARRASGPAELLARADAAMYRAKQAGRNRVAGPEPA